MYRVITHLVAVAGITVAAAPRPTGRAVPFVFPLCRAGDLLLSASLRPAIPLLLSASLRPTLRNVRGVLNLTNRTDHGCILFGGAGASWDVALLDAAGRALPLRSPVYAHSMHVSIVPLSQGRHGRLTFEWSNWCGRSPLALKVRLSAFHFTLTSRRLLSETPVCTNRSQPSEIAVFDLTG